MTREQAEKEIRDVYRKIWADKIIEALGQKTTFDKIRMEILEEIVSHSGTGEEVTQAYADGLKKGLDILDKYKAESEAEDGKDD